MLSKEDQTVVDKKDTNSSDDGNTNVVSGEIADDTVNKRIVRIENENEKEEMNDNEVKKNDNDYLMKNNDNECIEGEVSVRSSESNTIIEETFINEECNNIGINREAEEKNDLNDDKMREESISVSSSANIDEITSKQGDAVVVEEQEIKPKQEQEEEKQEEIKQTQLTNNDSIISPSILHSLIKPQQSILFTHRERNHLSTVPLTIEDETETEIKKMKTKRIKIQNCEYSIEKTSSHVVTKSHDCISYNLFFCSINSQLSNMIVSSSNSCIIYNSIIFPYHLQDQLSEAELIIDIFTVLLNSSYNK